jgi:hypothetical protein
MLQMLKNSLNPDQALTPRCLIDPILVSIDVGLGSRGCLNDNGIASLDLRSLARSQTEDAITARLLLLRRTSIPLNNGTRQYLFGIPKHSPPEAAREILHATCIQVDQKQGGFRNVFLVGHDIKSDIKYLEKALGFDIVSVPSIIAVIDAQQLARRVFSFRHKCMSLHRTLSSLGIAARQLNNSDNDAFYTLKALIHLFCNYQADAMDQAKLCVAPSTHERDEMVELFWRERLDLLRHTAICCPCSISVQERRQAARPPRPPRVDNADLFEADTSSNGETEGGMITIFGHGS